MPFLAPVFTAIGAFAASSVIAGFLVNLGGSLLLSAAAKALKKKPKQEVQGRTLSVREPVAPREIVYGRSRKGGTIIFMHTRDITDSPNGELHLVIVLADHPVQAIGNIYFNGELAIPAGSISGTGRWGESKALCNRALGTADQDAFPFLRATLPDLWTGAHRLRGAAAIWLVLSYNVDAYPQGIPNITADIWGKNDILDPRTGQRSYSENPALCLADYMADPVYGIGAAIGAADGINEAELIASANVCDEVVARSGFATEPRYACNGVLSTADTVQANIEAMLTAMAGNVTYSAGQFYLFAGYYRTPTVTLTADDARQGGIVFATRKSAAENFNAVRGTFISPENDWQPDDFPPYQSSVYLAEDGGERRFKDIALPFTISASMAQRLAKIELERQRRQAQVEWAGKLGCWQVGAGDVVNLTYPRFGFSAKPFDVEALTLELEEGEGGVLIHPKLTLRETSPLVYDWNVSEEQIYAAAPRTTLPSAFDIDPPEALNAAEALYETTDGSGVKAKVMLTWRASPSPYVDQYQVEASRNGGGTWLVQGRTTDTTMDLLDWAPGGWQFRVKAINRVGVSSGYAVTSREVAGLGAPPAALSNVVLQSMGGLAVLEWALVPDLDVRIGGQIVIRHSTAAVPTWANSVSMKTVPGATALAVVPLKPGAYILRARDASGTYGPETVLRTDGIQALAFSAVANLQEDTTFTGTKTGCFVTGGTLRLSAGGLIDSWPDFGAVLNFDNEGGILPEGTYAFAAGMDFGSVKRVRLRSVIDLTIISSSDLIDSRLGNIDDWLDFDGAVGGEVDVRVEIQTTPDNPSGSPTWSAWSRVDSSEVYARGVRARAVLTSKDATYTPAVSQLRLFADEVA